MTVQALDWCEKPLHDDSQDESLSPAPLENYRGQHGQHSGDHASYQQPWPVSQALIQILANGV